MPQIIPIRDLKNTAAVSAMCNETREPIYITKNGYGDMVIMSMEAYEEKMLLLDVYKKIEQAEVQIEEGAILDAKGHLNALKEKYNV